MFKGTPYTNKIVQKKQEQRSLNYHRNNLRKIKPIHGLPDSSEAVQINNGKKQYQNQIKFTQIERQNRILLEKITSIMNKTKRMNNTNDPWATARHNKSLNSTYRKKQLQQIEIENAKLLKRLQQKKPNYETEKFKTDWRKQKNVKKIMSNYPASLEKHKDTRHSLNMINHKNKNNHRVQPIQSYRVKVINGINFLITVKLTGKSLVITGDTKQSKGVKVIEIQREQAIQFIQDQCQGKIQLIFDRLRYDRDQQALYLVSNQITLDDVIDKQHKKVIEQDEQSNPQIVNQNEQNGKRTVQSNKKTISDKNIDEKQQIVQNEENKQIHQDHNTNNNKQVKQDKQIKEQDKQIKEQEQINEQKQDEIKEQKKNDQIANNENQEDNTVNNNNNKIEGEIQANQEQIVQEKAQQNNENKAEQQPKLEQKHQNQQQQPVNQLQNGAINQNKEQTIIDNQNES